MRKRAWWKETMVLLAAVSLAGVLWAAGLVICPKCGTEADATATTCGHCGALLPAAKEDAPPAPVVLPPVEKSSLSDLALDAAKSDRRLADESLATRPELAYAFYENALALGRLVKREGMTADAGKSLATGVERCRAYLSQSARPCPSCKGSGKRSIQLQPLSVDKGGRTDTKALVAEGPPCEECNGRGTVAGGRSVDEIRVLIGQGRRDFETRERALGRIAVGRVWVPAELRDQLEVKQEALLRSACPTPCSQCMGIGVQDCVRCKGGGRVKCNANGCTDGWVVRKDSNSLMPKTAITRKEPCRVCQGSGLMSCADCRGLGTVPCKNCGGSGHNAACRECGGQGYGNCGKCQGAGTVGTNVCAECRGKGVRLCPKCHGEGCEVR